MDKPQAKPPAASPGQPARTVTANTGGGEAETAPPTVPSAPSADTRGSAGTSTAEGPGRPKLPIPDHSVKEVRHEGRKRSQTDVSPPGERVDDEATDGKITKRQE